MSIKLVNEVPFHEFTNVKANNVQNLSFDIVSSKEKYCHSLLEKVFKITHSEIPDFIYFHLKMVKDKNVWLNKFEKLIAINEILFDNQTNKSRLVKLYTTIEITRHKLNFPEHFNYKNKPISKIINAESEKRYFSYDITVNQLDELSNDSDRILFLTNEIYEYKQANIDFRNTKLEDYAKLCKTKIEQIKCIMKLREELNLDQNSSTKKLKFNGNIN